MANKSASSARFATIDAVPLLSVFIVLLIGIPSRLIIGPLGGAGTPAQVLGLCLAAWWLAMRFASPSMRDRCSRPMRTAMLVFVAAVLASYIAAATRAITSDEMRSADLGLVSVISWLGVLLVAADAVRSQNKLDTLLRRLVIAGGALATLGIVQFVTKLPFTNYIQIPGLTANNALLSVSDRDGFTRPAGTALHAIEFGAVLTMILPIALHYAIADQHRSLTRRWYPVAAIAIAVPISISRSAIVSTFVVLAFLMPTWSVALRRKACLGIAALMCGLFVLVPGLLGTLTGLFTGISSDSSAQSRTGSYPLAWEFISRAPLFGRGFPTFLPEYRILDNQYLGILIDMGVVGCVALVSLFVTGVLTARRVRRDSRDPAERQLAQALAASVASAGISFAFFDAFSFPMASGLLFFILGCVGTLRRLARSRQAQFSGGRAYPSSGTPYGDADAHYRGGTAGTRVSSR
jgi:O-antigen ligase